MLAQPRDLLGVRVGAGRDDQLVVAQPLAVGQASPGAPRGRRRGRCPPRSRSAGGATAFAGRRGATRGPRRRDVDAVRTERELVAVRDEPDRDGVVESHPQEERRLQGGEAAAEHEDLGLGGHRSSVAAPARRHIRANVQTAAETPQCHDDARRALEKQLYGCTVVSMARDTAPIPILFRRRSSS